MLFGWMISNAVAFFVAVYLRYSHRYSPSRLRRILKDKSAHEQQNFHPL